MHLMDLLTSKEFRQGSITDPIIYGRKLRAWQVYHHRAEVVTARIAVVCTNCGYVLTRTLVPLLCMIRHSAFFVATYVTMPRQEILLTFRR